MEHNMILVGMATIVMLVIIYYMFVYSEPQVTSSDIPPNSAPDAIQPVVQPIIQPSIQPVVQPAIQPTTAPEVINQIANEPKVPSTAVVTIPTTYQGIIFPLKNVALLPSSEVVGKSFMVGGKIISNGVMLLNAKLVTDLSSDINNKIYRNGSLTSLRYIEQASSTTGSPAGTVYNTKSAPIFQLPIFVNVHHPDLSLSQPPGMVNKISSCGVNANRVIQFYDGVNYTGTMLQIIGPTIIDDFGYFGWGSKIKSFKVLACYGLLPVVLDKVGASPTNMSNKYTIPIDIGDISNIRLCGMPVNACKAISVRPNITVTMYSGLNFTGTTYVIAKGSAYRRIVLPLAFQNKLQSIKVSNT